MRKEWNRMFCMNSYGSREPVISNISVPLHPIVPEFCEEHFLRTIVGKIRNFKLISTVLDRMMRPALVIRSRTN